jgi:hypothetical protein
VPGAVLLDGWIMTIGGLGQGRLSELLYPQSQHGGIADARKMEKKSGCRNSDFPESLDP